MAIGYRYVQVSLVLEAVYDLVHLLRLPQVFLLWYCRHAQKFSTQNFDYHQLSGDRSIGMDVASETTELESGEASPEPREGGHEWIQLDSWWTHCRWRGKTTGKAWTCKPPLGAIPNGWTSGFLPRSSRPGDRGHSGRDLGSMGSWRSKRCYSQPEATNGAFRASLRTERSDAAIGAPGHTTRSIFATSNKKLRTSQGHRY